MYQEMVYGEFPVGGALTYVGRQPNTGDMHCVVTLTGHEIDSVQRMWIDGRVVHFSGGHPNFGVNTGVETEPKSGIISDKQAGLIELYTQSIGTDDQEANSNLVGATSSWRKDFWSELHRQLGCAHAYVKLHASAEKWDGWPDMSFLVRGKPLFDPRTGVTQWSKNAALVIADYLQDERFGLGVPSSSIYWGSSDSDIGSVWWAATICDQIVQTLEGDQPRYVIDTVIDTQMTASDVLAEMAETIAGSIVFFEGQWRVIPGVWIAPSLELTEADLLGPIEMQTNISKMERINGVKGQFISPSNMFEPIDFPPVKNASYRERDGGELWDDLTLNMCGASNQAQRIAKILLEKNRQAISLKADFSMRAFQATVGDVVELSFKDYGFTKKPFEVKDFSLNYSEGEGLSVQLTLHETAPGIYDWNQGEETAVDLAPNTDLPNAFFVEPPTVLALESGTEQLLRRGDGSVVSRLKVSYTLGGETEGGFTEIRYKLSGATTWNHTPRISAEVDFYYLSDVEDTKTYELQLRAANVLGVVSDWSAVVSHEVIGKTAPPSDVVNFQGRFTDYGSFLQWSAIPDLDLKHYEIRRFNDAAIYQDNPEADWVNSYVVAEVSGTQIARDLLSEGSHKYAIKAVDTSGNYSLTAFWWDFSVLGPRATNPKVIFVKEDYLLSWIEPHKTFAIDYYEIRFGATYETSEYVARTSALEYRAKADWSGTRKFFVTAFDIAKNQGIPGELDITIVPPGAVQNLKTEVIENNILINWAPPVGHSLPIAEYRIYRNATANDFTTAEFASSASGTFFPFLEFSAGTYYFWIVAVDSASNQGIELGTSALVSTPPDFRLDVDEVFSPSQVIVQENANQGHWGTRFGGHGLAREVLDNRVYSIRFTLPRSGNLLQALNYWKNDNSAGHSGGNGGTYRVSVYTDDGTPEHRPLFNGQIASTTVSIGLSGSSAEPEKYWREANFGASAVSSGSVFGAHHISNIATTHIWNGNRYPRIVSIRFLAPKNGKIHHVMPYWKNDNADTYSKGTGGTYDVHLMADDGGADGKPTGSPIATSRITHNIVDQDGDSDVYWSVVTFQSPPDIVEGTRYHLVFENVHSDPDNNFCSFNNLLTYDGSELPGDTQENYSAPSIPMSDWAICHTDLNDTNINSNTYAQRDGLRPTCVITLDTNNDGVADDAFGNGYIHAMSPEPGSSRGFQHFIGGSTYLRQPLLPAQNKTITALSLVMARYTGGSNGTGDLTVAIKDANGATIESAVVSSSAFQSTSVTTGEYTSWVRVPLSGNTTLIQGQRYYIQLSAPSGTEYTLNVLREGRAQGQTNFPAYGNYSFREGYMEVSTNGGASWGSPPVWNSPSATLVMQHEFEQEVTTSALPLNANEIYHLVIENIDGAPLSNFVSLMHLYADPTKLGLNPPATADEYVSPVYTSEQWNYLRSDEGMTEMQSGMNWGSQDGMIPICSLVLDTDADGVGDYSFGCSLVNVITSDVGVNRGHQRYITDTDFIRQSFVPEENLPVSNITLLVARKFGIEALTVELRDVNGVLISSGSASSTSVMETTEEGGENATWVTVALSGNPTLIKEETYYLELKTAGPSTSYMVNALRDGHTANFGTFQNFPEAGFASGRVEWSDDSGLTWALPTFFGEEQEDLQLCFSFSREQVSDDTIAWLDEVSFIPCSNKVSFQQWFDQKGHQSFQDQIDAGHTIYIEPMLTSGQVLFEHDMGEVLAGNTAVRVDFVKTQLKGSTSEGVTILTSPDGVNYTQHAYNTSQISAANFRYVRVLMDFINDDDGSVATYKDVRLRVFAKTVEYTTIVEFSDNYETLTLDFPEDKDFVSVTGVSYSIRGSGVITDETPVHFRWDVSPDPRPGSMSMWLFDKNGFKRGGIVSVTIKGIL